ncbi:MAG: Tripartite-type tricarboxylate transporter, receptor component TctC [Enterovirga sp.]|jgi:tripartite-type tricarboxylate transporter receptor subunit TctC|nr:Tripartite-type tricarboxylate transporter, receptor component TctC [Enterovirga sp.]
MKRVAALLGLLSALLGGPVDAQDYPSRTVTLVVPFAAGSGSDTAARVLNQYLTPRLGRAFVIENKVGATGAVASTAVARAEPDGYTLLLGTNSTHGSNSALYKSLAYDPIGGFDAVAHTGLFNYVLVINPDLPIRSMAELLAYGKANPGKLSYAGGSSTSIVMAETFAKATGLDILKVSYRSNPPALTDVIANRVSMMFVDMSSATSFLQAGNLRPLAVTTKSRSQLYPDLPTIDETAVKGFDLASWTGLFAPAGTPKPIVERLSRAINEVLALPEVKERFATLGIEPSPMSPETFQAFSRDEVAKWSRLVREAGIAVE